MAEFNKVIQRLENQRVRQVVEGLQTPKTRDAFELGRLCGIQQGLAIAQKLVEEALAEDEHNEKTAGR